MDQKSFVSIANKYFERFPTSEIEVSTILKRGLSLIVVVPVFNEENVTPTLNALFFKQEKYNFQVEVIFLVNNAENTTDQIKNKNLETYNFLKDFARVNNNNNISLFPFYVNNLNPKHAGVGWARKIGMDLALKRFTYHKKNGVIVGLDADAVVSSNYLKTIHDYFLKTDFTAVSIYFEHPINGDEFPLKQYTYIKLYELHLRYYKNALLYAGLPYSFHTVGSSFALTAAAYARQGGMNRRKAGEDFYFINKLIKGENFGEINDTKVIPSARISERVPFGTGRAILEAFKGEKNLDLTYDFSVFEVIKSWISLIKLENYNHNNFPDAIKSYLSKENWLSSHNQMFSNSSSYDSYLKRFFAKYDAFWMLKFIHFYRDNIKSNSGLLSNIQFLLDQTGFKTNNNIDEQLMLMRSIDQKKGAKAP